MQPPPVGVAWHPGTVTGSRIDDPASSPPLRAVCRDLRHAVGSTYRDAPVEEIIGFLRGTCGIPQSYLDAWEPMAAGYYVATGGLRNYLDEEKRDLPAIHFGLLVTWLSMHANSSRIDADRLTAADATGWSLVLAAAWANDERIQMFDLLDRWRGIGMHAWPYAAAGLTPRESWRVRVAHSPAGTLQAMAALRGVILPNRLPI